METDYQKLKQQVDGIEKKLDDFLNIYYRTNFPDKVVFTKKVSLLNNDFVFEGTGISKIDAQSAGVSLGSSTTQKISLYGKTPIVQQGAISSPSGGTTVDSQARSAIDSIRTALTNIGITA